jgi:hypothetical protein
MVLPSNYCPVYYTYYVTYKGDPKKKGCNCMEKSKRYSSVEDLCWPDGDHTNTDVTDSIRKEPKGAKRKLSKRG